MPGWVRQPNGTITAECHTGGRGRRASQNSAPHGAPWVGCDPSMVSSGMGERERGAAGGGKGCARGCEGMAERRGKGE
jgi:hypothetical protein